MIELLLGVATGFAIGAFIAYLADDEWHSQNSGWGHEGNNGLGGLASGSGKGLGDFLRWAVSRGGTAFGCRGIWCWLLILLVATYLYKKVK